MSKAEAQGLAESWKKMNIGDFLDAMDRWTPHRHANEELLSLGKSLRDLDRETGMSSNTEKSKYPQDLEFAIRSYVLLRNKYGMTDAEASDDSIWRYIQMDLVPDIVCTRWPDEDRGVNDDRMWKNGRRMWLKTLWWYVHLSWQGSVEETYKVLKDNTSDDISQLVERAGIGYRMELCREIMKQYADHDHDNKLLRRVLKLNVAVCGCIEPLLYEGGIEKYVSSLFKQLEVS